MYIVTNFIQKIIYNYYIIAFLLLKYEIIQNNNYIGKYRITKLEENYEMCYVIKITNAI